MRYLILLFLISGCAYSPPPIQTPIVEYITKYETVEVPVYVNPLDNQSIKEPTILTKFYFSDNGTLCLTEEAFKIMVEDFLILKEERNYYYEIIKELRGK